MKIQNVSVSRTINSSFFLLLILIFPAWLCAQNLVVNSSFELGVNNFCIANQDAKNLQLFAPGWKCPSSGTSDIFSTQLADKSCFASMPYNISSSFSAGSQLPRTGTRFAGIITSSAVPWLNGWQYREYLQTKLLTKLVHGESYYAEMYVSLGEESYLAANNLGMYFSDVAVGTDSVDVTLLPYTPQVIEKNVITDTLNWVKVSGQFTAKSSAEYLTIGNFYGDDSTTVVYGNPNGDQYIFAYYFIEDIKVEKIPYPNFHFSGDLNICEGEQATIYANVGIDHVQWTDLSNSTIISESSILDVKPLITTSYRVVARGGHLTVVDTVTVSVLPSPHIDLGKDTTICYNIPWKLHAGNGFSSYRWSDNSENEYLVIDQEGYYAVTVINEFNCSDTSDIQVAIMNPPSINLGVDFRVCDEFKPISVAVNDWPTSYHWSDGSTDDAFLPPEAGKYWVTLKNRCGEVSDTIRIFSMQNIVVPNILTLNGDGLNEIFKVSGIGITPPATLQIVDRWGKEQFSSSNYHWDWPTEKEGDLMPPGTYYYMLRFQACSSLFKGWLHMIR